MIETRKAQELDIVELTEDLPKYGVKSGERAVVITAFEEPDEAYDLEFVDESGTYSRFAYSVKPEQITNMYTIAREAFDHGSALVKEGKPFEAEREFQLAIDLRPEYIVNLHNWISSIFENTNEWEVLIDALRLVLRLNPDYEVKEYNMSFYAQNNLAMAYQNYAVQKANEGDIETAILYFDHAMGLASRSETISLIRKNLATAYTSLGIQAAQDEKYVDSFARMNHACEIDPNDMTRHNLGIAYAQIAKHYLDQSDYENSISCFEHAIDIGLIFPELLNDYGMALAITGHQEEAILVFKRAIKLAPDNEIVRHNLRLAEKGTTLGFGIEEIKAKFYQPPMQQHREYLKAA